jgi:Flp pilus assembly protein TadG
MNLIKSKWNAFRKNRDGIAATEFALVAPVIILLCLGGYEFARNTLFQLKLERVAFTVADITSQADTLTNAQINDILFSATQIMQPYTFDNLGVIHISSVYRAAGSNNTNVIWKRSGGGTATDVSTVGGVGLAATLPNNLTLNEQDNVIVVEVYYNYIPSFRLGILPASINMKKTTVFKPRLGALTTSPT